MVNTELKHKTDYTSLQSQLAELQTYKRQRNSWSKAKFEGKLSDKNWQAHRYADSEFDKVEEKLFALIGKKKFQLNFTTKTTVNKVNIARLKKKLITLWHSFEY